MELVASYRCMNCGTEITQSHRISEIKLLKRKKEPKITKISWGYHTSLSATVTGVVVNTENNGEDVLPPIISHQCNEGEDAKGIAYLVRVHNKDIVQEDTK